MNRVTMPEFVRESTHEIPEHRVLLSFISDWHAVAFEAWFKERGFDAFEAWANRHEKDYE